MKNCNMGDIDFFLEIFNTVHNKKEFDEAKIKYPSNDVLQSMDTYEEFEKRRDVFYWIILNKDE